MLRSLVSKNSLKFTVLIETPSKPFNEWTFPKVCELYGLSDDPNPSIDVYPVFSCGSADLSSEQSKAVAAGISFYKDNFLLIPEKLVEGRNGQGNLDYAVECRPTGRILGVVEVKKEDFMKITKIQTDATEVFQLKTFKQFPMMETFRNLIHDVLRGILSF
ncbi:hypothetical protein RhiirC2_870900 [Rhizophagus irregularis]|uniref:Crinkler family protein n=1 Tax=Rhizophagus irregularis TaxID=588596 RepID=A0A2N1MFX9_9GLOM|nr:hypothetical protein RhiirC2_870900 [Rhizophagus irregularis]